MRSFEDLTRLGRIRRMRDVAGAALEAYCLRNPRIEFIRQAGNTLFRVVEEVPADRGASADLFVPGRYLLRIHNPDCQSLDGVELVLEWLSAMRSEAGLPVQEPVRTLDGGLLADVEVEGGPGRRKCSLLRWLEGRYLRKGVGPRHLRAQGRLMARLHAFAAGWTPPVGPTKRCYDQEGLFERDDGTGVPAGEAWGLLPPAWIEPFRRVAAETKRVMEAWGEQPRVYGLIHGDLGVDANVLFLGGEARAIDFDDARFGYYVYDLAVALEHCVDDPAYPAFREALLSGYREIRGLPGEQADRLELFLAAFHVYWSLWAAAMSHVHPEIRGELSERAERYARRVKRFLSAP